jgi:uncharacterized protein involved in exopolysaccharide biosynthesis
MLFRRESIPLRLLDAFFRHWRVFLLCLIGVAGVVVAAVQLRGPSYVATISIRIIRDSGVSRALGMTQRTWESPAQQNVTRFNDLMQNVLPGGFVSRVLERAKLRKPITIDPEVQDPRFIAFRKGVFAGTRSQDVFQIGMTWDNPEECERLVQALQECYIEDTGLSKQAEAIATSQFLDSQLQLFKKRLQASEQALRDFKINNSGRLPQAQEAEIEQLASLKSERDILLITAQDNTLKREAILQRLAQIKPETTLEKTIGTDPMVLQMRELQAKRNGLLAQDWLPDSDPVREVDRQIQRLKAENAALKTPQGKPYEHVTETKLQDNPEYVSLHQQLTQVQIDERAQTARIALLNKTIGEYEARIRLLPEAERTLIEKTRDSEVLQQRYADLWQRREQALLKANVDRVTETSAYKLQNEIHAATTLGKSKKLFIVVASVLLGIVMGLLAILMKEWMDPTLRYETDTARLLGVPVLAALPESPGLRFPAPPARGWRGRRLSSGPEKRVAALPSPGPVRE